MQFHLPYFTEETQSAHLQFLTRPCNFWKYFLMCNKVLILKNSQFLSKSFSSILDIKMRCLTFSFLQLIP